MASVLLNVKTDPETKAGIKRFAAELGVSTTALVNMVLKQALRDGKITLTASQDLTPTPYLEAALREADQQLATGDFVATVGPDETRAFLETLR